MIEIKNVCKTYAGKKGSPPVKALDDVSIRFEDTGMVFILGKSGSGKSTLLNVLGGLDRYDSGEFIIKGKSSKDFSQSDFDSYRNTFIGFIFQEYNVLDEFTVGANIALAMELQGKKATKEALNDILGQVDLLNYASRKPNTLSGGQKQRVAIARALIKNPEIIMADEPTGALDSNTGKQVFDTLKKLSETKLVIVVSHDRDFAEQYGDRVIEFADGKIISDITKYRAAPETVNDGVNIIDDKIIHIKKGYTLTAADLKLINTYLSTSQSDTIISTDARSNTDFKRVARIDDEGRKESFADTADKDVKFKNYDPSDFKLIRSRLPIRNSIKIGASGLKAKPVRLAFTILLCFIAFALFGLADTMAAYNKYANARMSIQDTQIRTAAFEKQVKSGDDQYAYYSSSLLDDADLAALKEKTGISFTPLYNGSPYSNGSVSFSRNVTETSALEGQNGSQYYRSYFTGFAAIKPSELTEMGGELTNGQMPRSDDEIAVSRYVYEQFKLGGYTGVDENGQAITVAAAAVTPDLIVGKRLELNVNGTQTRLKIVGIFDSHMDTRYDLLKPSDQPARDALSEMILSRMYAAELQYSLHCVAVVSDGGMAALMSGQAQIGINTDKVGYIQIGTEATGVDVNRIATLRQAADGGLKIVSLNEENTVSAQEMILPLGQSYNLFSRDGESTDIALKPEDVNFEFVNGPNDIRPYRTEVYTHEFFSVMLWTRRSAWEYAEKSPLPGADFVKFMKDNADIFNVYTDGDPDEAAIRRGYAYFLSQPYFEIIEKDEKKRIDGGFFENPYADVSGFELGLNMLKKMTLSYADALGGFNFGRMTQKYNSGETEKRDTITLVGFALPSESAIKAAMNSNNGYDADWVIQELSYRIPVIFDADYIDSFNAGDAGIYSLALAPMPLADGAKLDRFLKIHYDDTEKTAYKLNNAVGNTLSLAENLIETLATVFLWVGVGFALFAALMMFNFIATSISFKKREIGILRAVGAKSSDVFGIFFNESLIITIINYVLAVIATAVAVVLINGVLRTQVGLVVTLLHFGVRQLALMLGVSILVAFVASFLPVYRISKKRPIDAIRGE